MQSLFFMSEYLAGIASCGNQGAQKAGINASIFRVIISALTNAFGGGLIRDLFFLRCKPTFFNLNTLPEIFIALVFAFIYHIIIHRLPSHKRQLDFLTSIADSIGVGTFLVIGFTKALYLPVPLQIFSGICTALIGGMLASLYNNKPISLDGYKASVISSAFLYLILKKISPSITDFTTILYLFVMTQLFNYKNYKKIVIIPSKLLFYNPRYTRIYIRIPLILKSYGSAGKIT